MAQPLVELEDDYTNGMTLLDYDTIKQDGVRKRIEGLYAPEIQQLGGDAVKEGSPGGQLAYSQAKTLIDAGKFYNVVDSGNADNHGRPLIRLRDMEGADYTDKSYTEGVVVPDEFSDDRARSMYANGQLARQIAKSQGIAEDPNDPWVKARNERLLYQKKNQFYKEISGTPIAKQKAYNEAQWAGAQHITGGFNPYAKGDVEFHTPGANYDGTAKSSTGAGWDTGWAGIGEGLDGLASSYYDMVGDEGEWLVSEERARANIAENQENIPSFINNVGDVVDLDTLGSYMGGLLGQTAPYLLTISGSAIAAGLVAPAAIGAAGAVALGTLPMAMIYAGQTYNDMEGDNLSEKSASLAFGIGAGMAALDRLGLNGLLKGTDVLRSTAKEQIAKAYVKNNKRTMFLFGSAKHPSVPITMEEAREAVERAFRFGSKGIVEGARGLVKFEMTKATLGKQVLADARQGITRESITELGQETLGYTGSVLGSEKEWNTSEYGDRALNAFIGGGLAGGIISPALGTPGAVQDYRRIKQRYELSPEQDIAIHETEADDVIDVANEQADADLEVKAAPGIPVVDDNDPAEVVLPENMWNIELGANADALLVTSTDADGNITKVVVRSQSGGNEGLTRKDFEDEAGWVKYQNVQKEQSRRQASAQKVIAEIRASALFAQGNKDSRSSKPTMAGSVKQKLRTDDITRDKEEHKEANKMSNKGVVQWIKDIGKNFVSRPMKWYSDSPMHKLLSEAKDGMAGRVAQALIVTFSPTNEDKQAGNAVWNKENTFFGQVELAVNDLLVAASQVIGTDANSQKGRINTTGQIIKWMEDRKEATSGRGASISADTRSLLDAVDNVAALISQQYFEISGKRLKITGEDLIKNRNPNKKTIKDNVDEVRRLLMEGGDKMTAKEADEIINDLITHREGESTEGAKKRLSIEDVVPSNPAKRFSHNPFNVPGMEKFLSQDIFEDIKDSAKEIIHTALVQKYVGPKGVNLKRLIAMVKAGVIKEGGKEAWDPKFAHDIISAAEIWMGVYNPIQSDRLRGMQANATFVNLNTLLGTGGPAQLPEWIAAFLGRISASQGGKSLIETLRGAAFDLNEHYKVSGQQLMDKYWKKSGLNPSSMWSAGRRRHVKSGWAGIQYGSIGQQGFDAEEINASKLRASISTAFVTLTGIKPMTDSARIISEGIGNDAIFHYLDIMDTFHRPGQPMTKEVREAYEMLGEVRIPPLKVLELYQAMKDKAVAAFGRDIDWHADDVQDFVSEHVELAKYLDTARTQWVDNALANPNPGSKSRPTFDPHLTLLFQFRGFIITFAASVLPRLIKRATSGNPNQDAQAITILAGLVAMGFLGQILKDEWKTEGRPYWLEDAEYIQRGFQASGLMGPFDFLLDAVNPIYGEANLASTAQGFMGPTWGNVKRAGSVLGSSLSGEWDAAQYDALKFVPIIGHKNSFRRDPVETLTEPFRSILGE